MNRDRDAQTILAVRFMLLVVILSVAAVLLVAGVAKVIAPGHDAGDLALNVGWPAGSALALMLRWRLARCGRLVE